MSAEFAAALNEICRKHDIILIVDEVQTCLARTGRLFASELVGLRPDIITIAKPLAGGLPLAATLLPKKVNDLLQVGDHGTTFGGGPVTCAVANAVWDIVADENFIDAVAAKGRHLRAGLRRLGESYPDSFGELKGAGLLSGIVVPGEIAGTPAISTLMSALTAAGLLTLRSGPDVLRIAPPLIVTTAELDAGLALVEQAAAQIAP